LIFGLANQMFGSLRYGILALIFYFIAGLIVLPLVSAALPSGGGLFGGADYPRPMVDLSASRARALAAFKRLPHLAGEEAL
jgi:hypothetical protein